MSDAGLSRSEVYLTNAVIVATVHPSSILRSQERDTAYSDFVADLRVVAGL